MHRFVHLLLNGQLCASNSLAESVGRVSITKVRSAVSHSSKEFLIMASMSRLKRHRRYRYFTNSGLSNDGVSNVRSCSRLSSSYYRMSMRMSKLSVLYACTYANILLSGQADTRERTFSLRRAACLYTTSRILRKRVCTPLNERGVINSSPSLPPITRWRPRWAIPGGILAS